MKPLLFLLNKRQSIKPGLATSTMMLACHLKGHPVYITDVLHFRATSLTSLEVDVLEIPAQPQVDSTEKLAARLKGSKSRVVDILDVQAIFVRTMPGQDTNRAWAHRLALEIMRLADELGIRVLNDPIGLQKASSKLYTVSLPSHVVPRTMVCHSLESVREFASTLGESFVLKPLLGSQGRDVFFLNNSDPINTRQIVDVLGRTGYIVVQEYLPEAVDGDIRVLTLDEAVVTRDGRPVGIRRSPAAGERRSNISLGGTASVIELSEQQTSICTKVAKHLCQDGIRFAGLDLIGEKIVEVNVYSPSGIQEFDRPKQTDVSSKVVEQLIEGGSA